MLLTQQVAKDKNLNTNEMSEKGLDLRLNITNNQCSKRRPSAKLWLAATRIRVSFEGSLLNYVNISGKSHHQRNQDVSQSVNYTRQCNVGGSTSPLNDRLKEDPT